MSQQDQNARELNHAEEVGRVVLPAGDHAAIVMQPGEQTLDAPATAIAPKGASVLACGPAALQSMRCDQLDAKLLAQALVERVTVVRLVTDQPRRRGAAEAGAECGFNQSAVMWRSTRNPEGERKTMAVRNCHDLGPFSAARWTNTIAPFFALLKEASMNASSKIEGPAEEQVFGQGAQNALQTAFPDPLLEPAMWHVWYGGYSRGRSRQRAPVRSIQSTPSSTARASRHGRPRPSARRFSRSSGRIASHCASLRCMHRVCSKSLLDQSVKSVSLFMR